MLLATACGTKGAPDKTVAAEPVVAVPTSKAEAMPTPKVLTVTGVVSPDETSQVAAVGGGKILAVMVDRGQTVKAGDVLVRLDATTAALGATEARANLELARAQRSQAEADCKRAKDLLDQNAITKSQFERENMACTAALQQVAAAEARTRMVSKSVSDGVVRAPFAGVITDTWVAPGEFVGPGMRLVTLVDNDPLKVDLSVPEAIVPSLKVEDPVELEAVAYPGKKLAARITELGVEINRMSRSMMVEATLDAGSGLTPGMFVEARVTVATEPRPAIPASATIKRGQTWRVFVVVDGRLQERVVQLGPDPAPGKRSVLQGLVVGEFVATTITDQVVDGLRVQ